MKSMIVVNPCTNITEKGGERKMKLFGNLMKVIKSSHYLFQEPSNTFVMMEGFMILRFSRMDIRSNTRLITGIRIVHITGASSLIGRKHTKTSLVHSGMRATTRGNSHSKDGTEEVRKGGEYIQLSNFVLKHEFNPFKINW